MSSATYRILTAFTGAFARSFYRISRLGEPIPPSGPLLLVANHPNGLVDGLLLAHTSPRQLRFLGKETLFHMPFVSWWLKGFGAIPVYRAKDGADTSKNADMFAAVEQALSAGDAVCLFPEGISHSEPALQRLKTGAARMALGAQACVGAGRPLAIVPVGLLYKDKASFQSRVAVWVGEPIGCADLGERYARESWPAVEELTARIATGLRRVTLDLDRWDDLPLLELAERIWRPGAGRRVPRLRALAAGLRALRERDPARAAELKRSAAELHTRLRRLGLSPADLQADYGTGDVLRFVLENLAALVFGLPLSLAGIALWLVPYQVVALCVRLARPEADIAASVKLVATIVVYPLAWAAIGWLAFVLLPFWPALALLLAAPWLGLFAAQFWLRRRAALADARVFLRIAGRARLRSHLAREAAALAEEIERVAQGLGVA